MFDVQINKNPSGKVNSITFIDFFKSGVFHLYSNRSQNTRNYLFRTEGYCHFHPFPFPIAFSVEKLTLDFFQFIKLLCLVYSRDDEVGHIAINAENVVNCSTVENIISILIVSSNNNSIVSSFCAFKHLCTVQMISLTC